MAGAPGVRNRQVLIWHNPVNADKVTKAASGRRSARRGRILLRLHANWEDDGRQSQRRHS